MLRDQLYAGHLGKDTKAGWKLMDADSSPVVWLQNGKKKSV